MDQDQGVGREVRRLREAKGWSQTRLAAEASMSVSGVSMIENGHRNLSTTTLAKLAEALEVGVRDLFPLGQAPLPDLGEPIFAGKVEPPSRGLGRFGPSQASDEEYKTAVGAVKDMYRRRRQSIVEFEDLPSNKDRREVLEDVISAYNALRVAGVSWERSEGLAWREVMVNAALHMLQYYETAPAQETAVIDLEEHRERLRRTA